MTTSNFQDLLNAAASNFNTFATNEQSRLTSSTQELYTALADIVAVRECLKFNGDLTDDEKEDYGAAKVQYCQFLTVSGVKAKDSQLSKSHPLVRALMPEDLREKFRSKISLYGQVVDIFIEKNIASNDIVDWLNTPEDVKGDGKQISGLLKAIAHKNPKIGKIQRSQPKSTPENDNYNQDVTIINEPTDLKVQLAFGCELYVRYQDETGKFTFIKVDYTPEQVLEAIMVASKNFTIAA